MANSIVVSLALATAAYAIANTTYYLSNPGLEVVNLQILTNSKPSALNPGYNFVTPFMADHGLGPNIYDNDGELVWGGNSTTLVRGMALHVCSVNGATDSYLCFNDAIPHGRGGHSEGYVRFLNNRYQPFHTYAATGGLPAPDIHEFNSPLADNGTTFISDSYKVVSGYDLTPYGGGPNQYIISGCFQDRNTDTGKAIFTWCSLAHVSPKDSYFKLNSAAGAGKSAAYPYDYFHINAIDRDHNGDYLVSSRQTSSLYKIAGAKSAKPGSIIWTLGGKNSSFTLVGGLNWSFQHHCRFHSSGNPISVVSLFNNNDNINGGGNVSSGLFIELNTKTMTAKQIMQAYHPGGLNSAVEGSTQLLKNGNIYMGWGSSEYISEHLPGNPGEAIYYAKILQGHSYRSFRYAWTGHPAEPPTIYAYQETCTSQLVVYMSWNGATEVAKWRVGVAKTATEKGTVLAKLTPKKGFETVALRDPSSFYRYIYAEALDASGNVLGTSKHTEIFVPKASLRPKCTALRCPPGTSLPQNNGAASCT